MKNDNSSMKMIMENFRKFQEGEQLDSKGQLNEHSLPAEIADEAEGVADTAFDAVISGRNVGDEDEEVTIDEAMLEVDYILDDWVERGELSAEQALELKPLVLRHIEELVGAGAEEVGYRLRQSREGEEEYDAYLSDQIG